MTDRYDNCGCDWPDNGLNPVGCPYCKLSAEIEALRAEVERLRSADNEVVFIDGVGAGRSSVKSCRDGVQWIRVGDRVYWPLSESDARRLRSACCGNGSFDGPTMPAVVAQPLTDEALLRQALEALLGQRGEPDWHTGKQRENVITALRERLEVSNG